MLVVKIFLLNITIIDWFLVRITIIDLFAIMITRNYFLAVNITLIDQLLVKITFMDLFLITTILISWQLEDFPYGSAGAVFGGKYYSD